MADSTTRDGGARDHKSEPTLLVIGEGMLATHALSKGGVVIGRSHECEIVLPSPTLSRRHVRLDLGPPLTVQDLGSRHGTRIGGKLVKGGGPVPLAAGDAFHIGALSFVVLKTTDAKRSSAASDLGLRVEDPTLPAPPPHLAGIAGSAVNVLILGETGVGKEVLAERLHALSGRSGPLVRINCAALSPSLLESELFGHEKGAFTGANESRPGLLASAKGGAVLLDEVGDLPSSLQPKLLRAIETREVLRLGATRPVAIDVRFFAATNRDLPAEVARERFRADLYFRLDGVTLEIPPLRERRHLIGPLALEFLDGRASLGADVVRHLESYDWPGNVRELRAVVQRALLMARTPELSLRHFRLRAPTPPEEPAARGESANDEGANDERARILAALEGCAGNQTRAARKLGISRATLVHKLALHRIPRPRK